jgi:hydroxyacylglutathione hydrolase
MQLSDNIYAYPWTSMQANNCNTYLVRCGSKLMMIDPGHAQLYGHVENGLVGDGIREDIDLVVLTHCHPDHMEAAAMLQRTGAKLAMGAQEAEFYEGEGKKLAGMMGVSLPDFVIDLFLEEGELTLDEETFQIILTPGHTPGHICVHLPSQKALFTGDLVFAQGVGRVDFPGGDGQALKDSILKIGALDLEMVLPGHGPVVSGADQVRLNFEVIEKTYFGMI